MDKRSRDRTAILALVCAGCGAPFLGYFRLSENRYCSKRCHAETRGATASQDQRVREL